MLLAIVVPWLGGCFSLGGGAGAWVSTRGQARYDVLVQPMSPEVRSHSPRSSDTARTYSFVMNATFSYTADAPGRPGGFTGTIGPALGVDQFRGRNGLGGLLTVGAVIGPEHDQGRFLARAQLRLERELNDGDWRIDRADPATNHGSSSRLRTGGHHLLGLMPGVEFVSGNHQRPAGFNVGGHLLHRYLIEVTSIGP